MAQVNKPQTVTEQVNPSPFTFGSPPARSCVVDNFSQSHVFIQDAGLYVPPLSTRVVALPAPQSTVIVLWQTPPGITVPPPGHGQCTIIWSDVDAPTTPSTPIIPKIAPTTTLSQRIIVSVNAGAVANIIPGVIGKTITVWGYILQLIATTAGSIIGHLEGDSSMTEIATVAAIGATGMPTFSSPFAPAITGGIDLTPGEGLQAHNNAASTITTAFYGSVFYTQK